MKFNADGKFIAGDKRTVFYNYDFVIYGNLKDMMGFYKTTRDCPQSGGWEDEELSDVLIIIPGNVPNAEFLAKAYAERWTKKVRSQKEAAEAQKLFDDLSNFVVDMKHKHKKAEQ